MVLLTAVMASALAVPVAGAPASAAEPDLVRSLQWQIQYLKLNDVHKKSTGAGIVVAVVDSGVDPQHPDLTGQVLQGPESSNTDIDGRGTGLAGLIAGHGHASLATGPGDNGILGIAPSAKILPVAFAPSAGENGDAERLATGVELATNRGAKIICIARGVVPTERLEFAVGVAVDKGILVVTADSTPWPASYPGVLAAIPIDRSGAVRVPAASGRTTGVAVPGVELMTTDRAGGYRMADATAAAAVLAGAAAVVWSANPDAKAPQIADLLRKTATTKGELNLVSALNVGVPKPTPSASPGAATPRPSSTKALTVGNALAESTDWRRWLVVLPLLFFMVCLAVWAYFAAKRRAEPTSS